MAVRVQEGSGVPKGTYVGVFDRFVLVNTGKGGRKKYLHSSEFGPTVRYIVKTPEGVEVPGSFPWDADHYKCSNALGAFGTPVNALSSHMNAQKPDILLGKLEKVLKEKSMVVSAWVREDSGWIRAITPEEGSFEMRFDKILTRDSNDVPIHIKKSEPRTGASGQTYIREEDTFNALLVVISGQNEGASFVYRVHYRLFKDNAGDWILNKSGYYGKAAYDFFKFHGISLEKLSPDKFPDPNNLLPQLEPKMVAKRIPLIVTVEKGWPNTIALSPNAGIGSGGDLEKALKVSKKKKRTKSKQPSVFLGMLMTVVNKETSGDLFDLNDGSYNMAEWKHAVKVHGLPRKSIEKYSVKDIYTALVELGYSQLADKVKSQYKRKKSQ